MQRQRAEQKPFLLAVCIIAPAIVLFGLYAVLAVTGSFSPVQSDAELRLAPWSADDNVYVMAWVTLAFWAMALPGTILLGYPVLRYVWYRGWNSYLVCGLSGLVCALAYRPLLNLIFLVFSIRLGGDYLIPLWFDWGMGFLMGLVARWAMTWRWLQWNSPKPS